MTLDERHHLTDPDGIQAVDGMIYVVYDHLRTPDGMIQAALFREDDAPAGKPVREAVRLGQEIDRLPALE